MIDQNWYFVFKLFAHSRPSASNFKKVFFSIGGRSVQFLKEVGGFLDLSNRTIRIQIRKNNWDLETYRKS